MTKKASEEMLDLIHQLVANNIIETLKSGEATAQDINAALKFLKDNDVKADIHANKGLQSVLDSLNTKVSQEDSLPFEIDEEDIDEETKSIG